MPPRALVRSFVAMWWTLGIALLVLSIRTVASAVAPGAHDPHAIVIGGLEAVSALLFLVPRTLRIGAAGLLVAIGAAILLHFAGGHFRWDLLMYAAAVQFVAVHGPVTRAQLAH
jgi:hypothetical protein